jgi:NADPH-dependent ferric siderophore reductase
MARRDPVPITVVSTAMLAPRARRVVFSGMNLPVSPLPGAFLSLWFSDPFADGGTERRGRSKKRTFTVRSHDPASGMMTIDFVLHGEGPASTWASTATAADTVWAGEAKGGYEVPPPGSHLVLVGDDTAIPAMGAILEAADPSVRPTVIVEVVDRRDERALTIARPIDPIWLHRGHDPGQTGLLALNLLESLAVPDDAFWWVAGERAAILAIRDLLVDDRGIDRGHYSINAHWRLAAVDPRDRDG